MNVEEGRDGLYQFEQLSDVLERYNGHGQKAIKIIVHPQKKELINFCRSVSLIIFRRAQHLPSFFTCTNFAELLFHLIKSK